MRTPALATALGLLVGAAFGLAGTLVASPHVQASWWAIDSVALVVATSLLALKYFRAAARIYAGEALLPTSSPLPFLAYPFLVGTLLGWSWMLLREES